jgi:hypothetical protein
VKSALLRDAVGTFTSLVGLAALALYQTLGLVIFDAAGALVAALFMTAGSLVLMTQVRGGARFRTTIWSASARLSSPRPRWTP